MIPWHFISKQKQTNIQYFSLWTITLETVLVVVNASEMEIHLLHSSYVKNKLPDLIDQTFSGDYVWKLFLFYYTCINTQDFKTGTMETVMFG